MVKVAVGVEQAGQRESLLGDEVADGLLLFGVECATVDQGGLSGLVPNEVAVLLDHVYDEAGDVHGSEGYVDGFFGFEEGFAEEVAELPLLAAVPEVFQLFVEVAAFEADEPVG